MIRDVEDRLEVIGILSRLTPKQRQAITLHYLSGCTSREVAARMGIGRREVFLLIARAKKKLNSQK